MSLISNQKRRMLPRWRIFHNAKTFDEINYLNFNSENNNLIYKGEKIDHINAIEEWREKNSIENAIELCSSSIVNNCFDDAKESASFILDENSCGQSVRAMAKKILNPSEDIKNVILDNPHAHIANLRKKTHRSPANPIYWVDIAFVYTRLGQNDKAERAIKNALILAPNNRFVVRCAARFFMHVDKIREARRSVENYRFIRQDPWILAVELSISSIQNITSKQLKLSKNVIEKGRVSPFHSSELASALGTTEMFNGHNKKALELFKNSLQKPTDNSIAQAHWSKYEKNFNMPLNDRFLNKDAAHEAQCYKFYNTGEWENFMRSAEKWAEYEPYSTRSFKYMSFVSLVCKNDPTQSIQNSNDGLKLSKNDFFFLNNLVVAHAQKGEIKEAEDFFIRIKKQNLNKHEKSIYTATEGMLAFRNTEIDKGRELYNKAISKINRETNDNNKTLNLAKLFFAREEIIAKTDRAYSFFIEETQKMKLEENKDVLAFKENIEKLFPTKR